MSEQNLNALAAGFEFDGYRVERVLGAGGFGITYRAAEIKTGRKVAIKEFLPQSVARRDVGNVTVRPISGSDREDFDWGLARFLEEAKVLITVNHPNVVRTLRYTEGHGTAYIVMDFVEGESLGGILRRVETLAQSEIDNVLYPLLDGLKAVHRAGFIHRDIKPDNIYIRAEDGQPVLIDFGAARLMARNTHSVIVSHGYAPPEQYESRAPRAPSTDIYAVGATLYRCMSDITPPRATDRMAARALRRPDPLAPLAEVTKRLYAPTLIAAVEQALRVHPEERPQDAAELLQMIQRGPPDKRPSEVGGTLVAGGYSDGVGHLPPSVASANARRPAPQPRSRVAPVLTTLTLLGAVLAGGYYLVRTDANSPPSTSSAKPQELAPPAAGQVFRDCNECPEMVVLPAGTFTMGSPTAEENRFFGEGPPHPVTIAKAFALGKYEVTFEEWDACVAAGGCNNRPSDVGWGRGRRPAIDVSWEDAKQYVAWLSRKTGKAYRLPSEAEWEYAVRAGTTTRFPWGNDIGQLPINTANCRGCGSRWDGKQTAPVGSFAPNRFGLHDMLGNLWEWVEDCRNVGYGDAPSDGRPWLSGDCRLRMMRGGAWGYDAGNLRSAIRQAYVPGFRSSYVGFRVAMTLD